MLPSVGRIKPKYRNGPINRRETVERRKFNSID
jgi:hypothetical protein